MGRFLAPLALVALAAALLAPAAAPAAVVNPSWCSIEPTPPCIQSASVDGAPVAPDHPRWDVVVSAVQDEERGFLWTAVRKTAGGYDTALGAESLDDTWVVTFNAGTAVPRIVSTGGRPGPIARASQADGTHRVTVTATPVVSGGDCDRSTWPWRCPSAATPEKVGALGGDVGDFGAWEDAAQRRAIHGLNLATNIPATSLPPEIEEDSATGAQHLLLRLAGPHFRADGATLFRGFLHLRIPAAFLRELYGIDDLATLARGGVTTEVGGARTGAGSTSIAQEPGGGALVVDIADMTFSARTVRVRARRVTPTRPTVLRVSRGGGTATVRFRAARARGSRIRSYEARCDALGRRGFRRAFGRRTTLSVRGLAPGVGYRCRVRARSRAGAGAWSAYSRSPTASRAAALEVRWVTRTA